MVKGTSRQVIVVQSPDPKLFEQAIFILKDEAVGQGISDEALLKEAQQVIRPQFQKLLYFLLPFLPFFLLLLRCLQPLHFHPGS